MTQPDSTLVLVAALLIVVAGFLVQYLAARVRHRQRVVEGPNSSYSARTVRDREDRDRWRAIDRARIHEINGEEVDRLLAKVDDLGVASLRPAERVFLERMVELSSPPRRPNDGPLPA